MIYIVIYIPKARLMVAPRFDLKRVEPSGCRCARVTVGNWRDERDPKAGGDSLLGCGRIQPARRGDEDRILERLRALRSDLIDPTIAVHQGRIVKRTGDGSIVEFRSVVDAVRCAIEVQNAMV